MLINLVGLLRYSGVDNTLGKADYKMVSASNPLGVITDKNSQRNIF